MVWEPLTPPVHYCESRGTHSGTHSVAVTINRHFLSWVFSSFLNQYMMILTLYFPNNGVGLLLCAESGLTLCHMLMRN